MGRFTMVFSEPSTRDRLFYGSSRKSSEVEFYDWPFINATFVVLDRIWSDGKSET